MKAESFEYLRQFEEVFEIAHRSNYVRNIPVRKLKRLISIYEEITGAKSGYSAYNMCRNGDSCLPAFMLELRVEYLAEKENMSIETDKTRNITPDKNIKNKSATTTHERKGDKERPTDEIRIAGTYAAGN